MIGMFSAAENRERLARCERTIKHLERKAALSHAEAQALESARELHDELATWFGELWRTEGGGVR